MNPCTAFFLLLALDEEKEEEEAANTWRFLPCLRLQLRGRKRVATAQEEEGSNA